MKPDGMGGGAGREPIRRLVRAPPLRANENGAEAGPAPARPQSPASNGVEVDQLANSLHVDCRGNGANLTPPAPLDVSLIPLRSFLTALFTFTFNKNDYHYHNFL